MKICVAIPYFNNIKTIYRCIDSVFANEYKPDELIIVDDGSDIKPNLRNYKSIKLFVHEKNLGLAEARNTALKNTRADLIFFFDSDVVVEKGYIKKGVELFRMKNIHGVGGRAVETVITEADRWRSLFLKQEFGDKPIDGIWMLNGLCSAYKTEILKRMGGFDSFFKTNGEDVDIGLRLGQKGFSLFYEPDLIVDHLRIDNPETLCITLYRHIFYASIAMKRNGVNRTKFYNSFRKKIVSYFKYALLNKDLALFLISVEASCQIFKAIRDSSMQSPVS